MKWSPFHVHTDSQCTIPCFSRVFLSILQALTILYTQKSQDRMQAIAIVSHDSALAQLEILSVPLWATVQVMLWQKGQHSLFLSPFAAVMMMMMMIIRWGSYTLTSTISLHLSVVWYLGLVFTPAVNLLGGGVTSLDISRPAICLFRGICGHNLVKSV